MKIENAIIPAAGLGTRMSPISKGIPKEMLSVNQKPMIFYAVEEAINYGIGRIIVVINSKKAVIKDYFERLKRETPSSRITEHMRRVITKAELRFLYQEKPLGLADAISTTKDIVRDGPFALLLPDNIILSKKPSLYTLGKAAKKYEINTGGLVKIWPKDFKRFGNCGKVELYEIERGVFSIKKIFDKEKGTFKSDLNGPIVRGVGRHILFPNFFYYIEKVRKSFKEVDDVPVFQALVKEKKLLGCLLNGKAFDVGNILGYQEANKYFKKYGPNMVDL